MRRYGIATATLFVLLMLTFSTASFAQQTNWAAVSSMTDTTGNVAVTNGSPLIAGHTYNLSLTVNVPFTQNSSTFTVSVSDNRLQIAGPQFWYVDTPNYPGYSPGNFSGSRSISFTQIQGTVSLNAVFTVPLSFTETTVGTLTLRFIQPNVDIVSITVTGGSTVGTVTYNVSDEAIQTYLTTYDQKSVLISSGKVDSSYST